jgi:hypothetical protein
MGLPAGGTAQKTVTSIHISTWLGKPLKDPKKTIQAYSGLKLPIRQDKLIWVPFP